MFENYKSLLEKVDVKFAEIERDHADQMQCRNGCFTCCAPGLTVFAIEAAHIQKYIEENPAVGEALQQVQSENPHEGRHCSFLGREGGCLIYRVRPIVCRSHGVPMKVPDQDPSVSVCPLNFEDVPLAELPESSSINTNLLNTLLSLINMKEFPDAGDRRFVLSPEGVREAADLK